MTWVLPTKWTVGTPEDISPDDEVVEWRIPILDDAGHEVGAAQGTNLEETQQYAQLMAAGPEFLSACKYALRWIGMFGEHAPIVFGGEAEVADRLQNVIARVPDLEPQG